MMGVYAMKSLDIQGDDRASVNWDCDNRNFRLEQVNEDSEFPTDVINLNYREAAELAEFLIEKLFIELEDS